jgi:hypothetical protein
LLLHQVALETASEEEPEEVTEAVESASEVSIGQLTFALACTVGAMPTDCGLPFSTSASTTLFQTAVWLPH